MNVLLVEPTFPIPAKSKNHKNFLPIGLLKIAAYLRESGAHVKLVRGTPTNTEDLGVVGGFNPDEVWTTSLFTYWARHVRDAVQCYKAMFPHAKTVVGGIYASLLPKDEVKEFTGCDEVWQGVIPEAESCVPAYDLVQDANPRPIDYQIIHASRGCKRKCTFCGTWKIEPAFLAQESIKNQVKYRKLVFYDNNFLMNPSIEDILQELVNLKEVRRILWCECQSGFDGRILLEEPHLAKMIKKAGFRYPRIAWDGKHNQHAEIREQTDLLVDAGYHTKEIYVFVLYNWDIPFEEMEMKRGESFDWQVQIADCRYRPLDQLYDNYDPNKLGQTSTDYYIHEKGGWTDTLVKQFRKNVREQNICVRLGFPYYSRAFEHKRFGREITGKARKLHLITDKTAFLETVGADYWLPGQTRYPS